MNYFCCTERRRSVISGHPTLNGIDFLEVLDDPGMPDDQRQRTLFIHFVNPVSVTLSATNILIDGGERIKGIAITKLKPTAQANVLEVDVDRPGDFSTYTLRLMQAANDPSPPDGYDRLLSSVDFSFKVECPNDFDCRVPQVCPPQKQVEPAIDYLAKDYASFRRVMLDRMALLMPGWAERNPADLAIVLVELLAYVGDYLSYQQDAIATEAYIGTARRRISVRRHARLVDYPMQDGSNARVWAQIQVSSDLQLAAGTQLLTRLSSRPGMVAIPPGSIEYDQALALKPEVFELLYPSPAQLLAAHNIIFFYTWGDEQCCLPAGATQASLSGKLSDSLQPGEVLIFQEQLGPLTGDAADANPAHRHAVRLTSVTANSDPLGGFFLDPPVDSSLDVTEITWDAADALPFALCISARTDEAHGSTYFTDVSVALGNIVLADNGLTRAGIPLDPVPEPVLARVQPGSNDRCSPASPEFIQPRYRPRLQEGPLTQVGPFDPKAPVSTLLEPLDMTQVMPSISLADSDSKTWQARRDLLDSGAFNRDFVAEVEEDSLATLRFGDDVFGMRPRPGTDLQATYRIGNGARGNIGAETLAHIVSADPAIIAVNNPLAAWGGVDPESIEEVRQRAPVAFRRQERAVTLDDYAEVAQRHAGVQRAAATFRWTGSWRTVFLTIDRRGGLEVDAPFKDEMRRYLERYRLAGQDVEIDGPRYVSLEIEMQVCVLPGYFRSDVEAALLTVLSNRILPDGRPGVFYPDNFTFGQAVNLSPLYAAAQAVPGVNFVEIKKFQRLGDAASSGLIQGMLLMDRLEIARLDNDPNFPEHGAFRVSMLM